LSVHYLPEACNPIWHRTETPTTREEHDEYACEVVVVGNIYPYREHILDRLPPAINLRIYGNLSRYVRSERVRKAYTGRYVTKREKALAFGGAQIVLNTLHYGEIKSLNARLFEATACGGFVLTHASPVLDQCFVPGEEVIAFETPSELVEAISVYLADDETRRRVAAQGQQRSHQDHTYGQRLREILGVCHLTADTSLTSAARSRARLGAGSQVRATG
jgi:spore maturation protein CgeB